MKIPTKGKLLGSSLAKRTAGTGARSMKPWSKRHENAGWPVPPSGRERWFRRRSRLHTAKILRLSQDLPVVIEIVDAPEKIEAFLPDLDTMVQGGLVTVERAQVIFLPRAGDSA